MKYLTVFLVLVSCNFCFGQGARFQLLLTKACTTIDELDTSYYLMPIGHPDTVYLPKKGTVYLPEIGKYMIGFNEGPVLDSSIIEIKDTSMFIYRFKESKIHRYLSGVTDTPPVYLICDSLINGYAEDFFSNGKLKIRGNFKNGHPKDSIVTFYATGKIEERINILPKVVNIEEYDSSGNLVKLSHNQNKSFMTYWEYRWIEFYTNGKVKSDQSSVKRIIKVDEFYPTGQLKVRQTKNRRIEYYENGIKSKSYNWHSKKDNIQKDAKKFTINEIEYDKSGQLLHSAIFEDWNYFSPQPELDISKSDWIINFKKYKDGKEISSIEDIDTKEFVKNHPND